MKFLRELFGLGISERDDGHKSSAEEFKEEKIESPITQEQEEQALVTSAIDTETNLEGSNVVRLVKLKNGDTGLFKPVTGENIDAVVRLGTGYKRERAAYLVSLFLGFNIVPTTVIREIDGTVGSLQKFIPSTRSYYEFRQDKKRLDTLQTQLRTMHIFDFIIANNDRGLFNFNSLVDERKKLWAIDHGFAFGDKQFYQMDLAPTLWSITDVDLDLEIFSKIKTLAESELDKKLLRSALLELLTEEEVDNCIKRLEKIAEAIVDGRISKNDAIRLRQEFEPRKFGRFTGF